MTSARSDYCYTPFNLAVIINNRQMSISEATDFLAWVYENDSQYIHVEYRYDMRKLSIATMQYSDYLLNKTSVKMERSALAKDYQDAGITSSVNEFFYAEIDPHHYLKSLRLRILYFNETHQARTTLRQILKHYGYRRRNHAIIEEIEEYLEALGLAIVDDGIEMDLFDVKLDDRLVFEVRQNSD